MSGTGTSFETPYHPTAGGLLSQPLPSNIGGNPWVYEDGANSVSVNYAPTLQSTGGGGRRTRQRRRTNKKITNKQKRRISQTRGKSQRRRKRRC